MKYPEKLHKLIRYIKIYGLRRALFKAAGRERRLKAWFITPRYLQGHGNVAIIGCGQFGFASIGAVLALNSSHSIRRCFDTNVDAQVSFESFYSLPLHTESVEQIFEDPKVAVVYIASNHSSHSEYAIRSIQAGKTTYIEKPIAVSWQQFFELERHIPKTTNNSVYFGYNRPFSPAIQDLKKKRSEFFGPMSMSFFIRGHKIESSHWYRDPEEGSRICGNLGHWLDLSVHILSWETLVRSWQLTLVSSDRSEPDDNFCLIMKSERGDIISITLASRIEPYEGIYENIQLQWGNINATINDFRQMRIEEGEKSQTLNYKPKNVGHVNSILQPMRNQNNRWEEVRISTQLMLEVLDLIGSDTDQKSVNLNLR